MVSSARTLGSDDRGVSTAVSYTIAVGITVILVAALLLSLGGLMDSQSDRTTDSELRVVGEGVATDLTKVDRLMNGLDEGDELAMRIDGPDRIAGQSYRVTLTDSSVTCSAPPCVEVATNERSYLVNVDLETSVTERTIPGGTIWIVAHEDGILIQENRP